MQDAPVSENVSALVIAIEPVDDVAVAAGTRGAIVVDSREVDLNVDADAAISTCIAAMRIVTSTATPPVVEKKAK